MRTTLKLIAIIACLAMVFAGYAGGITSAAMDGIRVFEAITS